MGNILAGTVEVLLKASTAQYERAMGRVTAETRKSAQNIQKDLKVAGVALLGLGTVAVKMAADFDKGLAEVASLMDGVTKGQIKAMGQELKTLSVTAGQSLEALTKARYDIVSAGFRDSAESAMLLEEAAKLAAGTVSDAGTVGAVLTKTLNAYGLAATEAARVSDILAVTIKQGQTTMRELGPTIGQVIPTAAELGIGLEELSAGIATLTAGAGQQTPEAMTALNAAMVSFLKPSEDMKALLKDLGYESGRAALNALGFGGTLDALQEAAGKANVDLADIFPNIRAMRAAFPLAGKQAGVFAENLEAARQSAGQAGKMFATVADSDSFKLEQAMQQLRVTMVDLGSVVLPQVAKAATALSDLFKENEELVKGLGEAMAFTVEHAGKLALAFGAFKLFKIAKDVATLTIAITGLKIAINPLAGIITAATLALGAFLLTAQKGVQIKSDPSDLEAVKAELKDVEARIKRVNAEFAGAIGAEKEGLDAVNTRLEAQKKALEDIIAQYDTISTSTPPPAPAAFLEGQAGMLAEFGTGKSGGGKKAGGSGSKKSPIEEAAPGTVKALGDIREAMVGTGNSIGQLESQMEAAGMLLEEVELFPEQKAKDFAATMQEEVIASVKGYTAELEFAAQAAGLLNDIAGTFIDMQVDKVTNAAKAKEEAERDSAKAQLKAIDEALAAGTINTKQAAAERALINQSLADTVTNIQREAADEQAAIRRKQKPFLIAEAIANTAVGVTKALPNLVLAGLVAALGGVQVAKIASAQYQQGTSRVPGVGSGDIVEARLEPGEGVLTKEAMRNIGTSTVDSLNRGGTLEPTGSAREVNVAIYAIDSQSFEDYLNTRGREPLIRVVEDIETRGVGASNT